MSSNICKQPFNHSSMPGEPVVPLQKQKKSLISCLTGLLISFQVQVLLVTCLFHLTYSWKDGRMDLVEGDACEEGLALPSCREGDMLSRVHVAIQLHRVVPNQSSTQLLYSLKGIRCR